MPGVHRTASHRFSVLKGALASLDLLDTLAGEGPFPLFAPTNEAFAQVLPAFAKAKNFLLFLKLILRLHQIPWQP